MLTGTDLRMVGLTVVCTLLSVGLLWALWRFISMCIRWVRKVNDLAYSVRTCQEAVHFMKEDVARHQRIHEKINAEKLAERLYGKAATAPFPLERISNPPELPTVDATDWLDDDERPSAKTLVKNS